MFSTSSIIVGLEIGTSKVCAVVGDLGADGALNIVGLGQSRSRGVRKGEIADAPAAEEDVRHAIVEAEQMADVEIRSVYLGVTGGLLQRRLPKRTSRRCSQPSDSITAGTRSRVAVGGPLPIRRPSAGCSVRG
ncbi:MAG: hypothetical protein WCQ21_23085 [Verrucomicrobiota bacterium]